MLRLFVLISEIPWDELAFPTVKRTLEYYIQDKKEGQGIYTWKDGCKYDGAWKDDMKWGKGVLVLPTKEKIECTWEQDRIHGTGHYTDPNGKRIPCNWNWIFIYLAAMVKCKEYRQSYKFCSEFCS